MGMQSIQVLFNTSEVIYVLIFIGSIFTTIWHILRINRQQLTDIDPAQASMAVQTHLEIIFNKKFRNINSTLENIEVSTDALLNRLYSKETGLDDEIKTYLTKKFNEVNAENHENMLALYDKLLNIEGHVWSANDEQYDNFMTNTARFSEH